MNILENKTLNTNYSLNVNGNKNNRNKVKAASIIGSAAGIAAGVAGVYALAKKGNPSLALKNLSYSEKDVLMVGAGSVLGGLFGGLISEKDKNNVKPKLREASQQFIGNMVFPIGTLALGNHLLQKTNFKLPKINANTPFAKTVNGVLAVLPKVVVSVASLVGGMHIGNKIMNKVNDKIFKEHVQHDVEAEDFLVHCDDLCLAANLLLKDSKNISKVTNKILPLTFIIAGSKTGMAKENKDIAQSKKD